MAEYSNMMAKFADELRVGRVRKRRIKGDCRVLGLNG